MIQRKIIHVDMDAFYASVEQRDRPELKGRPVVVGGKPGGRGVVSAASYEARAFGIHSAMPASRVQRLCPDAVFVSPNFKKYRDISDHLRKIFREYTDLVEPLSLDECYLDVTETFSSLPTATAIAQEIRARIYNELGLTASAGVAPYKYVAKIASDFNKPDGLTVVPPERLLEFLHPLPVKKLPGVGPSTNSFYKKHGIHTIGDLAALREVEAVKLLGKNGIRLWKRSRGIDNSRVRTEWRRKSRSAERTFGEDVREREVLLEKISQLSERVCQALVREGLLGRTVRLKVRYADFTTLTRATTLQVATNDSKVVNRCAVRMLDLMGPLPPIRLLGVGLGNLIYPDLPRQLVLDFS